MNTTAKIALVVVVIMVIATATLTARTYNGGGAAGVAWNWGGVEIKGQPGIFLCGGNTDMQTGVYTDYPLADLFPSLLTDC